MINRLTHHFDELIKLYGHRLKEEEVLKLKKKFEKRLNAMNQDMNCQERLLLQLKVDFRVNLDHKFSGLLRICKISLTPLLFS